MHARTLRLGLAAGLATILLTPAAHAGRYELGIGPTTRALRASSADALTGDTLGGGQFSAARRLDLPVFPGLVVWADAAIGWGSASGTMFQTLGTEIGSSSWTVGARARYRVIRNVWASGRLDLGMARASVTLTDASGRTARDHGWAPVTQAALGVDLLAVDRRSFAFGVRLELGYVAAAGVGLTAHPDSPSDGTLQLPMSSSSLGHLDLSGPSFDLAFVSQF